MQLTYNKPCMNASLQLNSQFTSYRFFDNIQYSELEAYNTCIEYTVN